MGGRYDNCCDLQDYVDEAREHSDKRDELKATLGQIDRIFKVPETVAALTAQVGLDDVNLLEVHQELAKLEDCRDKLVFHVTKESAGDIEGVGREVVRKYVVDNVSICLHS